MKLRIPSPTRIKQTKPTRRPPPPSVQPPRRPDRLEVPTDGLDAPQDAVPLHLQLRVAATAAAAQAPCESEDRRQQGIWIRQSMFGRSDSLVNGGSEMPPSMIFRCANAPTRSTAAPLSGADDSLELHARSSSQRRLEHRPASATPRQPRLAVHQGGEFDLQPRLPRLSPLGEDAQDDPNSVNDLGGKDAHAGNEVLKGMGSCMDLKPRACGMHILSFSPIAAYLSTSQGGGKVPLLHRAQHGVHHNARLEVPSRRLSRGSILLHIHNGGYSFLAVKALIHTVLVNSPWGRPGANLPGAPPRRVPGGLRPPTVAHVGDRKGGMSSRMRFQRHGLHADSLNRPEAKVARPCWVRARIIWCNLITTSILHPGAGYACSSNQAPGHDSRGAPDGISAPGRVMRL